MIEPFNFSFFNIRGWGTGLGYCDVVRLALEMNRDYSIVFKIAPKYCILDSFVDYDGYSISPKGFLPKVVDIMVTELNLPIPVHFSSLIPRITMFTLTISLGHFQFTLSHGPNIPGSYAIFFLELQTLLPSPVTSAPRLCFGFGSASSFFLGYFSTLL